MAYRKRRRERQGPQADIVAEPDVSEGAGGILGVRSRLEVRKTVFRVPLAKALRLERTLEDGTDPNDCEWSVAQVYP